MPSGSANYDINDNGYRIAGKVTWSISGTTVTWKMTYTTYEMCIWSTAYQRNIFQGKTNSAVKLTVDGKSVSNANQFSGYSYGTGAANSGWVQCKTGTLQTTTTLKTGTITAKPEIVIQSKTTNLNFTLAWAVTYNGNGATSGSNANQTKVRDTNLTLSNCGFARTGYTFTGWNTAANGSGTSYAAGATYTGNAALTLYAQWQIVTYAITYDGNGNTGGSTASQTKNYNASVFLQANGFTRTNYVFLHWNTAPDDSGTTYAPGYEYTVNKDLALYAIWKRANIPVFVNPDGTVHQVEKVYININDEIKQVTVYANPDGTIREIV